MVLLPVNASNHEPPALIENPSSLSPITYEGELFSSCSLLPNKMMKLIFAFLPRDKDVAQASIVCRRWKVIINNDGRLTLRRLGIEEYSFGQAKWGKYFGDIGTPPSLPSDIQEILSAPCPFWLDKKVRETHLLVLIPNTVNGNPFHLDALAELIQHPKAGHRTKYEYYDDDIKNELGAKSQPSHWILMTRDVIPGSRNKTYDDQKAVVQRYAQESGIPYELPTTLETVAAILVEHVETGICLYSKKRWTYTRCREKVDNNEWRVAVGGFSAEGLFVISSDWNGSGAGVCRKL